jgi:hypothetical protein
MANMRKVDYMGSEPFASKLLFAPPIPGSEDDFDDQLQRSPETFSDPSSFRHPEGGNPGDCKGGIGA